MNTQKRMDGKRVLVTGSGTGIGRGVALEFAREGAAVALHYGHSKKGAQQAVDEIREWGGQAEAFQADFSDVDQARRLGDQALEFLGGLDVLINNAGITVNMAFEEVTPEHFDKLYHVNVRGQFFLTQRVVPAMAKQGSGAIVNVTSVHAFAGKTHHAVYAGTKGAILSYTRELALELAPKGIHVTGIAPGWVRVENQEVVLGETFDWEAGGKTLPAGYVGMPRDIARLAIFLASGEGRYIVGQTIIIDGGQCAIMPNTGDFREPFDVEHGRQYLS